MNLLQRGEISKKYFLLRCTKCGALYILREDDLKYHMNRNEDWYEFRCTCCTNVITLSGKDYKTYALTKGQAEEICSRYNQSLEE